MPTCDTSIDLDPERSSPAAEGACSVCHNLDPGENKVKGTGKQLIASAGRNCEPCSVLLEGIREFGRTRDLWEDVLQQVEYEFWLPQDDPSALLQIELKMPLMDPIPSPRTWHSPSFMLHMTEEDLELYTVSDSPSPWPGLRASKHLYDVSTPRSCSRIVQSWIGQCAKSHKRCQGASGSKMPTRVVDVGSSDAGRNPFLYEPSGESELYACLSHCWGEVEPLRTTKKTLHERKNSISWNDLPQTFRDAIEFTRELGLKYLWIDSLCIIQDDDNDWEREASSMQAVYGGSYITIAATACYDASRPLFPHSSPARSTGDKSTEQRTARPSRHVYGRRRHLSHAQFQTPEYQDLAYPLMGRAWVYQEHMLPSRIVQFALDELVWECNQEAWCCCNELAQPLRGRKSQFTEALLTLSSNPQDHDRLLHDIWARIVQDYSSRMIKFSKDKLAALAGIAQKLESIAHSDYLAGLWRKDLVHGLCWEVGHWNSCWRPDVLPAPTWSWASTDGTYVTWRTYPQQLWGTDTWKEKLALETWPIKSEVHIIGADLKEIKLLGRLVHARFIHDEAAEIMDWDPAFAVKADDAVYSVGFWPDVKADLVKGKKVVIDHTVYCLKMGTCEAQDNPEELLHKVLILRMADSGCNIYKRVGIMTASSDQVAGWFEDVDPQEITLI